MAKWFSIWNGDPGGHQYPQYESFIILVQPLSFFWRMLHSSPEADDVQHRIYDEIHDASAWQLFLLSLDISKLVADPHCGLKIFLMSATLETPVWKAIEDMVRRSFGGKAMGQVKLHFPRGVPSPAENTMEIPENLLPDKFDDLEWDKQACYCIQAIRTWWHKRDKSAAILIIVPGEAEMVKFIAQWIAFSKDQSWNLDRVDSSTHKKERQRIRDTLETQNFRRGDDNIVVATNVFEKGITLCINGLIDSNLAVSKETNGFLKVGLCTPSQNVQRKGRGGRVAFTLWKALTHKHLIVQQETPYEMRKNDAMSLIVGSILLQKHFPIIGISHTSHAMYFKELEELGIISKHANVSQADSEGASRPSDDACAPPPPAPSSAPRRPKVTLRGSVRNSIPGSSASSAHTSHAMFFKNPNACYQLTAFGQEVTRHSLDLHVGMLVAVCARFDLLWHGRIAAAYIQTAQDCFLRTPLTASFGLQPNQLAAGHQAGDDRPPSVLHTAVHTYLSSIVEDSVPDDNIFSGSWVNKIHDTLRRGMQSSSGDEFAEPLTAVLAARLMDAPNWEDVVTCASAWAFSDYVAVQLGGGSFRMNVKRVK